MTRSLLPTLLLLMVAGCTGSERPKWVSGELDTDADTDTDTDTDTDADTDTDGDTDADTDTDTDSDTTTEEPQTFDEPGDVVTYQDDDGDNVVEVELTDASGDSNRDQEFLLILLTNSTLDTAYRIRYYPTARSAMAPPPMAPLTRAITAPPPRAHYPVHPRRAAPPPPDTLDASDVGTAHSEFLIRNDLTDDSSYATASATLWALGTNVAIWVDDDVNIDWDFECNGIVDVAADDPAYGFDNCDLSTVVEILDENVIPNVRSFFGDESDINGDGVVNVVITPELNAITLGSDDDTDWSHVLSSYTEPQVDLSDFDREDNPGSDEQEIIYVFAPDPYGFFNPNVTPDVDAFTNYQLIGEVARGFTALISYNQHVIEAGFSETPDDYVEEDWVNDALGTLAADLCGFGAAYYSDAWEYLDAPHLYPLQTESGTGSLDSLNRGAQYTFGRWLYEWAEAQGSGNGVTVMTSIMQSGTTGVESINAGTGESDIVDTLVGWQVAMAVTGLTNSSGTDLVDTADYVQYADPSNIVAPPSSPGNYYGANGYQLGLDLHGTNTPYQGGTTDSPEALTDGVVLFENTDAYIYTPGFEFTGWLSGGTGAQVVRLTGITYDSALLQIQATQPQLTGAIIRLNDPDTADYTIETIFSATDSNPIELPTLPTDLSQIHGVGQITTPATTTSIDADGVETTEDVDDTDRWLLDLTDRSSTEDVHVAVWLDRHFQDSTSAVGPDDPWIAVVPRDFIPEPTVEGTQTNASCTGAPVFGYPVSMLEYLYYQQFLSATMNGDDDADFEPCGTHATDPIPTCATDWDGDGVADADEPLPENLFQQILVQQCTLNGGVPASEPYSTEWMDVDERDEDTLFSRDLTHNTGGRSGPDDEEAYADVVLRGGQEYLIVVGGNGGTGTYELSVREIE